MKKTSNKSGSWRLIVSIALSLALILYLGYQIYSVNHDVIKTEYALDYTFYQTIPLQGFFVRDESVLTNDQSGVLGYTQASGSKVSAGQTIARVFDTAQQAAIQTEIDQIDKTIKSLDGIQVEGTQLAASAEILDSRINTAINQLQEITDRGHTQGLNSVSDDLLQLLNKKQVALGTAGSFNTYIEALNAQKAALVSQLGNSGAPVTVDQGGYFVNSADGCEDIIEYDSIEQLSVADVENALNAKTKDVACVGKLVASSEWYIASVVEQSISQHISKDDWVEITIPLLSDQVYRCQVASLTMDYAAGKAVLVLRCSQMDGEVAKARVEKIQLRMNTYHGMRINQSAMRVVDGITGVYVVDGISAVFKPVEIIYSDTGFAICAYDTSNTDALKQYDEVIIRGGDLYDGKIIR